MKTIDTFCPECWCTVEARIESRPEAHVVRETEIETVSEIAVCPLCGTDIGDSRLEDANIQRAYDVYRKTRGVIFPQQIKELRVKYGISQKSLGVLLGIGEASIVRYEDGSLPSNSNNMLLRSALNDSFIAEAFRQNGSLIPRFQQKKIEAVLGCEQALTAY